MSGAGGGFGANVVSHVQRKMLTISLKKTGLGSPAISGSGADFCSIVDNGVGDYTINFTSSPFAQTPEVVALPSTPGTAIAITSATNLSITLEVTDLAGVAAEGDFHLMVMGSLARDLVGP